MINYLFHSPYYPHSLDNLDHLDRPDDLERLAHLDYRPDHQDRLDNVYHLGNRDDLGDLGQASSYRFQLLFAGSQPADGDEQGRKSSRLNRVRFLKTDQPVRVCRPRLEA